MIALDSESVRRHLAGTVRALVGLPASAPVTPPELPERLARLLLRAEEYERSHRDQWDGWEFGFSENFRAGRLWDPEVDRWAAAERRRLAETVELEPLWPDGHPFAVCLSHDVDLVSDESSPAQVLRSMRAGFSGIPAGPGERVVRYARPAVRLARAARGGIRRSPRADALAECVRIEREHGVTASYFFTVWPETPTRYDCLYAPRDRCSFDGRTLRVADLMRLLADDGFDVGLHGSYGSPRSLDALQHEKEAIERATGRDVLTTRQHFLHWDIRTTPKLHESAGIAADSSLGFNRNLGFRAGTSLPHRHFDLEDDRALDLLEVPIVIHDGALFRPDALELDLELAKQTVAGLVDAIADNGGLATFVFHPNYSLLPDYRALLEFAISLGRERNAWFASVGDVNRWWRERERRLAAS